jgi:hypothetical protein
LGKQLAAGVADGAVGEELIHRRKKSS